MEKDFEKVVKVVKKLRRECPWDKKQTNKSLRRFVVEESYELVDAIDKKDKDKIVDELGDILLQVLLHSAIGEEKGEFKLKDVLENLEKKLKRRHPHIFGDVKVKDEKDVLRNWVEIKKNERNHNSIMDNIPVYLPSLILAYKVQKKASSKKFEWEKVEDVLKKVDEEINELKEAIKSGKREEIEDELGDIFFMLVNLSRFIGVNPEDAHRKTISKFIQRFRYIEMKAEEQGRKISDMTLEEMDRLWDEAKG